MTIIKTNENDRSRKLNNYCFANSPVRLFDSWLWVVGFLLYLTSLKHKCFILRFWNINAESCYLRITNYVTCLVYRSFCIGFHEDDYKCLFLNLPGNERNARISFPAKKVGYAFVLNHTYSKTITLLFGQIKY